MFPRKVSWDGRCHWIMWSSSRSRGLRPLLSSPSPPSTAPGELMMGTLLCGGLFHLHLVQTDNSSFKMLNSRLHLLQLKVYFPINSNLQLIKIHYERHKQGPLLGERGSKWSISFPPQKTNFPLNVQRLHSASDWLCHPPEPCCWDQSNGCGWKALLVFNRTVGYSLSNEYSHNTEILHRTHARPILERSRSWQKGAWQTPFIWHMVVFLCCCCCCCFCAPKFCMFPFHQTWMNQSTKSEEYTKKPIRISTLYLWEMTA